MHNIKVKDCRLIIKPEYNPWGNGYSNIIRDDINQFNMNPLITTDPRKKPWNIRECGHNNPWEFLDKVNLEWKQKFEVEKLILTDFESHESFKEKSKVELQKKAPGQIKATSQVTSKWPSARKITLETALKDVREFAKKMDEERKQFYKDEAERLLMWEDEE